MPQRALSCTRASLYRTGGPEHGPGNARGGMPITEVRNPDRYPVPAHSPAERGFAPLRFRPARFGKAGPYASDNTPRNDPGTAVAKHAATGQPVPENRTRCGRTSSIHRNGLSIAGESSLRSRSDDDFFPYPTPGLSERSVANRPKQETGYLWIRIARIYNGTPPVPSMSSRIRPPASHASGNLSSTAAFPSLRSNVIGVQSEAAGNESPGIDPPASILRKSSAWPPFSHLYSKER